MSSRYFNIPSAGWLFSIAIFAALLIPAAVQQGMFLDGVTYAAIARNLANGFGSFWDPHYTQTLYPAFHEHPPLVFGIQSMFFKLLGSGFYVEKFYSLLTAIITATGMVACWRQLAEKEDKQFSWLPVLFWITIPVVFWSYQNNMLENTMGMFTIFATFSFIKAMRQHWLWWLAGCSLVVLAVLSKGLVGLFPLVAPLALGLVSAPGKWIKPILQTLLAFTLTGLMMYIVILVFPQAWPSLEAYLQQQLFPALRNEREITTGNRFSILLQLLLELSLPLVILMGSFLGQKFHGQPFQMPNKKQAIFYLLMGLAASIPLIITLKQRKFYLIPSIPFYVLAFSYVVLPYCKLWVSNISRKMKTSIVAFLAVLLAGVVIYSAIHAGDYQRDEQLLKDVHAIAEVVPPQTIISPSPGLCYKWELVAYLARFGQISLSCSGENELYYMLPKGKLPPQEIQEKFEKVKLGLKQYQLLREK